MLNRNETKVERPWSRFRTILGALILLSIGSTAIFPPCASAQSATKPSAQSPHVLVVANANNASSIALANYYMKARAIPSSNLLLVKCAAPDNTDTISTSDYQNLIATPVYNKIKQLAEIDFIVLCRNLPTKINASNPAWNDLSVDSCLAAKSTTLRGNPYCYAWQKGSPVHFTSKKYGCYLVTRLDGQSWADATGLVDNALKAKSGGTFFLDEDPARNSQDGYSYLNTEMGQAYTALLSDKVPAQLGKTFIAPPQLLGGYYSWGSNDSHYSAKVFNALRFTPGCIGETCVSTSAIDLRYSTESNPYGQSQIATLIHNGISGVKGYVSEPYTSALANPDLLFPGYVAGLNAAESFYNASMLIGWKDVVVCDPLMTYTGK